jgi:hypothetical protein
VGFQPLGRRPLVLDVRLGEEPGIELGAFLDLAVFLHDVVQLSLE